MVRSPYLAKSLPFFALPGQSESDVFSFFLPEFCYTYCMTGTISQNSAYHIWAADNVVYGPVELPALIDWVKDKRVLAETWVFDGQNDRWRKAASLPELQLFFRKPSRSQTPRPLSPSAERT